MSPIFAEPPAQAECAQAAWLRHEVSGQAGLLAMRSFLQRRRCWLWLMIGFWLFGLAAPQLTHAFAPQARWVAALDSICTSQGNSLGASQQKAPGSPGSGQTDADVSPACGYCLLQFSLAPVSKLPSMTLPSCEGNTPLLATGPTSSGGDSSSLSVGHPCRAPPGFI